jgi:hypothetical protein
MELVKISKVIPNENNPRFIKDSKFKKLVKSIKEFPEMLKLRPIVVNKDMVVLGGNMRLKACKEAGLKEVYILKADELTKEQEQEFIVKDNVGFGEWDWDSLANEWELKELEDWGLDGFPFDAEDTEEDKYTRKIEAPTYKPNNEKPNINDLTDDAKYKELITDINNSTLDETEKKFLIKSAQRHIVFDYSKIADYYANSNKEVQDLMERSALIIIDFDKAIESGYVKLTNDIAKAYKKNGIL